MVLKQYYIERKLKFEINDIIIMLLIIPGERDTIGRGEAMPPTTALSSPSYPRLAILWVCLVPKVQKLGKNIFKLTVLC